MAVFLCVYCQGTAGAVSVGREDKYPWEVAPSIERDLAPSPAVILEKKEAAPAPAPAEAPAARLAASQTLTGTSRNMAVNRPVATSRNEVHDEYITVIRDHQAEKQAEAAKEPNYARLISTEDVQDETRKVIVGRARPGGRKTTVTRIYADDENPVDARTVPPAKVFSAVTPPQISRAVPAPAVSSTRPMDPGLPPPIPSLAREPVKAPVSASSTPLLVASASPGGGHSASFMAAKKPAPVEEDRAASARPVERKKSGVPLAPDAQSNRLAEMVVVAPTGKTIRMTSYLMAKNLLSEGDYVGADRYARDWLEKYPEDWRAWQLQGNIQVELRAYGQALKSFKKSLDIHPDNPPLKHYVEQAEGKDD